MPSDWPTDAPICGFMRPRNPTPSLCLRSAQRGSAQRRGLTLVELTITFSILLTLLLCFCETLLGSMKASRVNRESAVATDAARQQMELLQARDFTTLFAAYNSVDGDDPVGLPASLASFEVTGLDALRTDDDGLCGEIIFPEWVDGDLSELRENIDDNSLAMPMDLNGDGAIDALDHATDYAILPVIVRVEWRGAAGPAHVQFKTIISNF